MKINQLFSERRPITFYILGIFISAFLFAGCSDNKRKIILTVESGDLLVFKDGVFYKKTPVEFFMEEPPEDVSETPYGLAFLDDGGFFEGFTVYGAENVSPDAFFTFHKEMASNPITFPSSRVERLTPSDTKTELVIKP